MIDLSTVSTCDLVEALASRTGVVSNYFVNPDEDFIFTVSDHTNIKDCGPIRILMVIN